MRTSTLILIATVLAGGIAACEQRPEPDQYPDQSPPPESTIQILKQFVPETPAAACGGFTWRRMEDPMWVFWRLVEKAGERRTAITFGLVDLTDHLEEVSPPNTTFAGFPAWRGKGYLEVRAGNVSVVIMVPSAFPMLATDAVIDSMLSDVDLQRLSKL